MILLTTLKNVYLFIRFIYLYSFSSFLFVKEKNQKPKTRRITENESKIKEE